MQKVVGTFLGLLLARLVVPMLLGPIGMVYFSMCILGAGLVFLLLHVWAKLKMRRLRRKFCDEALLYALKKRQVFEEPDYQDDELRDIRRARKSGDFEAVHSVIASANKRLSDRKFEDQRLASAQAQKKAELRRPSEIRQYQA